MCMKGFSIKIGHTTKAPAKRGKDSAKRAAPPPHGDDTAQFKLIVEHY